MITHISFDLWGTLIKNHPEYKGRLAQLVADELQKEYLHQYSQYQCLTAVNFIGRSYDHMVELWGISLTPTQLMHMLVCDITGKVNPDLKFLEKLNAKSQNLIKEYPPVFYSDDTKEVLVELKRKGFTLSIASNTGFIGSGRMRDVLHWLDIAYLFDFYVFSDEIKYSKPHGKFFEWVVQTARDNILHVGDNNICDGRGAIENGMKSLIINSNDKTIKDALNFLDHEQENL